jgi:hypothetical protein
VTLFVDGKGPDGSARRITVDAIGHTAIGSPQDCPHLRHQLARTERLLHIVVGSEFDHYPVDLLAKR